MIERIVYVSLASPGVDARTAFEIVRVAHNRNSRDGLTGGLLLLDGCFIQVLEGHPVLMRNRFERIRQDSRHRQIELRGTQSNVQRLFPDSWMALRQASEVDSSVCTGFGYRPGLPADSFSADQVCAFVQAACRASTALA